MNSDLFSDLKKEVLEIKDRYPSLSDDNAFVTWFLRAFITEDEKQAYDSLTGKSGDKSSDAIYFDHDNRIVFIIQGKYHLKSNYNEKRSDIIALADLGRCILTIRSDGFDAILNKANPIVKKSLEETRTLIHKRDYQLVLRYVTTGKISETNKNEGESRLEEFEQGRFETYCYIDLIKLMQDYIEGAAPPVPTVALTVQGTEVFQRHDKSHGITSWIFTMNGNDIGNLFKDVGIRLFSRNIRGYLGNTEINRVMKKTIEDEPEFFWYFNNGITIVCDEAKQIKKGNSNIIKATNAQIINGQQTTRTLSNAGKNSAEVLIKLIEIPRQIEVKNDKYNYLVSEIVSATNWQNSISQSDLKSNDIEQVRIEKEFKKLNYYYIRKRMTKSEAVNYGANKFNFKISKDELSQALTACSMDPYLVRLGKNRLFEEDIYCKIFNGRKASEYINTYWLYRKVLYYSKGNNITVSAKWHVLHLIWNLLSQDLKKNAFKDHFRKMIEREKKYQHELDPLFKLIQTVFKLSISFYNTNKKNDEKIQEARDFFKHAKLHDKFQSFVETNSKQKKIIENQILQLFQNIEELNE